MFCFVLFCFVCWKAVEGVCLCNRSAGQQATTGGEVDTAPTPALQVSNSPESSDSSQIILLQTAEVTVASQSHMEKARLILDSGSQRSYISTELSERLGLRPIRQERLLVRTFGSDEEMVQDAGVVQVPILALDGSTIYLTAYQIPIICRPLQSQPVMGLKEQNEHLCGLFLADSSDGSTELRVERGYIGRVRSNVTLDDGQSSTRKRRTRTGGVQHACWLGSLW